MQSRTAGPSHPTNTRSQPDMDRRPTTPFHLILMLMLAILPLYATPVGAAEPGGELVNSSGTIGGSQTHSITIYSPGSANIRLEVGGGAAGNKLTLSLRAAGGAPIQSWEVQS